MDHTVDSFTAAFAHGARRQLAGAQVSVEGPLQVRIERPDVAVHHVDLENAWRAARAPGADADEVLAQFMKAVSPESVAMPSGADFVAALRPLIKSQHDVEQLEARLGVDQVPVTPLVGDLSIVLVVDTGEAMAVISRSQLDSVGLEVADALEAALQNLADAVESIEVHGDSARMVVAGGNYEASMLLLSALWVEMAEQVRGDLVAVPLARDLLVFADTADAASMALLAKMRADGEAGLFNYAISTTGLRWTGRGWALWEG